MNEVFREITDRAEWSHLGAVKSPFFDETWERELIRAFPYITLRRFIYRDTHAVRLAQIGLPASTCADRQAGDRVTSVPFSDGGDVVALSEAPLALDVFRVDLIERFGKSMMIRVHESFAPVVPTDMRSDLIDFRVPLVSFSIDSVRKTLRHILDAGIPQGDEIRLAVSADTERIYELYLDTMHDAGGIALPRTAFDSLMSRDVFVFIHNGSIEAASVFFTDETSAFHFISASSSGGKREHAPHHLLFHAIKHYQQSGKSSLFLGGTNAGSSLRTFKQGWRGEECRIYTVSSSSAHEIARRSPLRALWKLIPASLLPKATKLIGKRVF